MENKEPDREVLTECYNQENENLRTFEEITTKIHLTIFTGVVVMGGVLFLYEKETELRGVVLMITFLLLLMAMSLSYYFGSCHLKRMKRLALITNLLNLNGIYHGNVKNYDIKTIIMTFVYSTLLGFVLSLF